jgi:metal-dependent hydrolase (beta-lactamase superfamily II)
MSNTATFPTVIYTVSTYDQSDREWFIIGGFHMTQSEAHALFEARKSSNRVRIQKLSGGKCVTVRDSNMEA